VAFTAAADRARAVGRTWRGPAPLTVRTENRSTGPISTYAWDFGDGGTSNDRSPSHVYERPGTYRLHLKLVDHLERKHGTTESEDYQIVVTGWRPTPVWRAPAILGLALLLVAGWWASPWQYRRIRYEFDGAPKTHASWTRDLKLSVGTSFIRLPLRRTFWLRKRYVPELESGVEWQAAKGDRPRRAWARSQDTFRIGDKVCRIKHVNHAATTGLVPLLLIVSVVAIVAWLAWNFFV